MSKGIMTVSWPYAAEHIEILDGMGFPKEKAYKIFGVSGPTSKYVKTILPAQALSSVLNAAEKALNDPLIGLKVGYEFRVSNFQQTGKIYSFCKDLNQVLDYNMRYQPLAIDVGKISKIVEVDKTTGQERYFMDYVLYDDHHENTFHLLNMIFAAYGTAFRWLTWGSATELKAVYFQYPLPSNKDVYTKVFQCPVFFSQDFNRIEFNPDCVHAPLATRDDLRLSQHIAKLEALISSTNAKSAFLTSLRKTIEHGITEHQYHFQSIADAMGQSETKLKENLKQSNIKYRDILTDVRKELFDKKYCSGMSFTQIALDLGYSDQAAFSKAFKNWYGISPTEYKNKTLNSTDD